jgi:hypothetical protein
MSSAGTPTGLGLDKAAIGKLLADLIRVGEVASVGTDGRVRVTFADRNNVTSQPLQVLHRRLGDQDMPEVGGAKALCLMLPPDNVDGWVLGVFYDKKNAPPVAGDAAPRVIAGNDIRWGSEAASHPGPFGDILVLLLQGIFDLLKTAVIPTPAGPAPLSGDATGANSYGSGGIVAVLTAMEAAADGLAGLNSTKIKLE